MSRFRAKQRAFWMHRWLVSNPRDSASSCLPLFIACNPREKEPCYRFSCDQGDVTVWMFGFVVENIAVLRANEEARGRLSNYLSIDGGIPQACDLPRLY
jgi:hypothetical protein